MVFAPDTEVALRTVVNLINSAANGREELAAQADLDSVLAAEGFSGSRTRDEAELASVRERRDKLAAVWAASEDDELKTENGMLRAANELPQMIKHDGWD